MKVSVKKQILDQVSKLHLSQQKLALNFASSLKRKPPRGVPAKDLLTFAGCMEVADVETMSKAIEEGCERVDVTSR